MKLKTVVIPAAGMGTRMLPATKSVPKELLPVYDTPLMHFALCEAVAAGAERIVVVSHPSKTALEDYLAPSIRLERSLERTEKFDALETVRALSFEGVDIRIVHQDMPLGLGHAVLQAKRHVEEDRFGVILPDDLLLSGDCLAQMAQAFETAGALCLVGAMDVPREKVSSYGIFDVESEEGDIIRARGMVEKPAPEAAPSQLAALGRYVLHRDVFDALEMTQTGAGGEIQLTDAIAATGGLHAFRVREERFDCGTKDGLFAATCEVRARRKADEQPRLRLAAE